MPSTATMLVQSCLSKALPLLQLPAGRYGQCKNDCFSIVNCKFGLSLTNKINFMKVSKGFWSISGPKSINVKPSENVKIEIKQYFQPLIEDFKIQCIMKNPNKEFNYLIDIYSKWNRNYFYFCEKYKSESENRLADEFEVKFLRLKFIEKNLFELSYFRHTGQWQTVIPFAMTIEECKEMILSNPVFQPIR